MPALEQGLLAFHLSAQAWEEASEEGLWVILLAQHLSAHAWSAVLSSWEAVWRME